MTSITHGTTVTHVAARTAVALLVSLPCSGAAQTRVDSALAAYIAAIKAVDNHAHPMRATVPGAPPDTEYDALPLDAIPAFSLSWRLRSENPIWAAAGRALYDMRGPGGPQQLTDTRARVAREQGERFPNWVLDRVGIDVMLANRVALGPGLAPPRFRWVPFVDALMLPLDTRAEAARTPDTQRLYPKEAALLRRYLRDLGLSRVPTDLDTYIRTVVTPTLERQRRAGAVAVKFEAAYLRPLDFDDPDAPRARAVYARYAIEGTPTRAEYKALEDYLFRVIAREAGRLGLAVHIHVTNGFGGFYVAHGSEPYLLEPVFNDSTLRATNFVILHGGWPMIGQTASLLAKPNVYADISMMDLFIDPAELTAALRMWLSQWPEKILFGTDAFDGGAEQGWGEAAWLGTFTARQALGAALTQMLDEGTTTRARAETVARMVLRDNAAGLYHLGLP